MNLLFIAIWMNRSEWFLGVSQKGHTCNIESTYGKCSEYSAIELCLSIAVNRSNLLLYIAQAIHFFSILKRSILVWFCLRFIEYSTDRMLVLSVYRMPKYANHPHWTHTHTIDEEMRRANNVACAQYGAIGTQIPKEKGYTKQKYEREEKTVIVEDAR